MSINKYFLRESDNMTHRKKTQKLTNQWNLARKLVKKLTQELTLKLAYLNQHFVRLSLKLWLISPKSSMNRPLVQLLQVQCEELDSHEKQISEAETRISALEENRCDMSEHIDDFENRGRRKNIRIDGLPEEVEGNNPTPENPKHRNEDGPNKAGEGTPLLGPQVSPSGETATCPGEIPQLSG